MGPRIVVCLLAGALLGAPACVHADESAKEIELAPDEIARANIDHLLQLLPSLEGEWTQFEMPMLRLLAADPALVHPAAVRHMQRSMDELLTIFDLDGALRAEFERKPIRYLHGLTRQEVSTLAGVETDGMALWGPRIVLSRRLPHVHELVHIIAHLAMSSAEIAGAEPLLREGVAAYLGGARGHAPQVVLALGDSYLDLGLGDPSLLLAPDRFFHSSTDASIHYATAARFVQFLVEEHGWDRFGQVYGLLAASGGGVASRPAESRRLQFSGVYERSWEQLWSEFHAWRREHPVRCVESVAPPSGEPDVELFEDGRRLRLWKRPHDWVVQLRAELGYPEVHLQWGERLPESFRSRQRVTTGSGSLLRYSLVLRPEGVELIDLALDEVQLAMAPRPLEGSDGLDFDTVREFCVQLNFESRQPPWPHDPTLWATPRLR